MKKRIMFVLATILAIGLTSQAYPDGKKGPRASVASNTQCAIENGLLVITTTLTNKSSSGTIPAVTGGKIQGTYKLANQRGNASEILGTAYISDLQTLPALVARQLQIRAEFDLCDGAGQVKEVVKNARELNGSSEIDYGISGATGETRTVTNRCTDDPNTEQNEGGIKVADVITNIMDDCAVFSAPTP